MDSNLICSINGSIEGIQEILMLLRAVGLNLGVARNISTATPNQIGLKSHD